MSTALIVPPRVIPCDPAVAFHRVLEQWRAECPCRWHGNFADITTACREAAEHGAEHGA